MCRGIWASRWRFPRSSDLRSRSVHDQGDHHAGTCRHERSCPEIFDPVRKVVVPRGQGDAGHRAALARQSRSQGYHIGVEHLGSPAGSSPSIGHLGTNPGQHCASAHTGAYSGCEDAFRRLVFAAIVRLKTANLSYSRWMGSTHFTSSGCSTGSISRLTTTASPSLRTSTHSSTSSREALIS